MALVTVDQVEPGHTHVRLLAGPGKDGRAVYELVPASAVETGVYDVLASPAIAYGCAAGDRIRVAEDGRFGVLRRGGNICLVLLPRARPTETEVGDLTAAFRRLGGIVESPPDGRFIVVTVPASAGFPAVEEAANHWTAARDCPWEYGNVFDDDGNPLNWWTVP
jgi:hypothetical protein